MLPIEEQATKITTGPQPTFPVDENESTFESRRQASHARTDITEQQIKELDDWAAAQRLERENSANKLETPTHAKYTTFGEPKYDIVSVDITTFVKAQSAFAIAQGNFIRALSFRRDGDMQAFIEAHRIMVEEQSKFIAAQAAILGQLNIV